VSEREGGREGEREGGREKEGWELREGYEIQWVCASESYSRTKTQHVQS